MIIRHAQRAGRHLYISHHVRASAYRANASAPCRLNDTVAALPVTEASRYSKSALPKPYCRLLSTEAGDDISPEDEDPQRYEFFGPQIHERRVDLSDPSISKMSPVQLARRVISLDVGTFHPDDVTHGLVRLIKDCCMLQTEASMEVAKGLLQRLVEEKRYINATLLRELNGDGADNAAEEGWGEPLVIAHLPWLTQFLKSQWVWRPRRALGQQVAVNALKAIQQNWKLEKKTVSLSYSGDPGGGPGDLEVLGALSY